jgi:hypothetical protein
MTSQGRVSTEGIVAFTYSSIRDNEGEFAPSRLSLMSFDAAAHLATQNNVGRLVVAGEQSYGDGTPSTGDLLAQEPQSDFLKVDVLHNEKNHLINTSYQVEELARYLLPLQHATVVAWEYHLPRIQRNFAATKMLSRLSFVSVDSVIDTLWGNTGEWGTTQIERSNYFQRRYDLAVDWPEVKERGLHEFDRREQKTRLGLLPGNSGWALNVISHLKGAGRLDDFSRNGTAIIGDTTEPRYPRAWKLAASLLTKF